MSEFRDGTGSGYKAKVDSTNRITTRSIQQGEIIEATNNGDGFNIHTGLVDFATAAATDSALLYFKNNEPRDFIINNFIITCNNTGTLGDSVYCKFVRNPTAGTIVTGAVNVAAPVGASGNRDTGSSKDLGDSLAYVGGDGQTFTDGSFFGAIYVPQNQTRAAALNVKVSRGGSFGFTVDTDVTAGTLKIYAVIIGYYRGII